MTSWNDQTVIDAYTDSSDDPTKSWYEEAVNIPAICGLLPAEGATVLDFGCGPGNFTAKLSKTFAVTGADAAGSMVAKARSKFPGIPFFTWDGLTPLPEIYVPFDAIVTKLTLEFIAELPLVVRNVYDGLRAGGILVVSVQHPLLAIAMHPEEDTSYWGSPTFDVQIGTTGTTVTKIQRNLKDYTEPFILAGFTLTHIDEPEIPADIAVAHNARAIDRKFPKRLNLQFRKD